MGESGRRDISEESDVTRRREEPFEAIWTLREGRGGEEGRKKGSSSARLASAPATSSTLPRAHNRVLYLNKGHLKRLRARSTSFSPARPRPFSRRSLPSPRCCLARTKRA